MPDAKTPPSTSSILRGIAASPGIGIGKAFVLKEEALSYVFRALSRDEVKREIQRLRQAMARTRNDIHATRDKVLKVLGKTHTGLIDVHLVILDDPLFKDVEKKIAQEFMNAESALVAVLDEVGRKFDQIGDEFFRERKGDIMDVGRRIMRHLLGHESIQLSQLAERSIVIAHDLAPSDTISLRDDLVEGFATDIGGRTSHTAILAQGLEIPAVVGMKDITAHVKTGDMLIVDGNDGRVFVNPNLTTLENYRKYREIQLAETRELEKFRDLPAQTLDGRRVILASNIENPEEIKAALGHGAEGIGLYRTEFLYLNRTTLPTEEEHYDNYSAVAHQMLPYSVIIRTVDLGGDKLGPLGVTGLDDEPNPFLGLRGIRLCLRYPDLFKTQLRAILRASVEGKLKIMYPMITSVEEVRQANHLLNEVKDELRAKNVKFDAAIEVGVMIETPSAAVISDILARETDFLSLGTNDLIQYTLAVDRINANVAPLYNPLHLGVLRLIGMVVKSAHDANKWVGMCGEMAGDPTFTKILLGLGLDELSVAAAAVPKIKRLIRESNDAEVQALVKEVLQLTDHDSVLKRLAARKI
ncbi:MAG TPA: phosphoenolpyruvate--protein phosphotransferase [Elusimicrobiota bacterium]|nr:phosphoenolpyruvate--protein phosphotransferase [Elusimicrobiota bacterium]